MLYWTLRRIEGEDLQGRRRGRGTDLVSKRTNIVEIRKSLVANQPITASSIDVSASSVPSQPALDEDALKIVLQRIIYFGEVKEAFHSAYERAERNISQDDILAMLDGQWTLAAAPNWDSGHKNWKYKLAGVDLEGDALVLVIAVNEEMQRILIITKY